MSSKFHFFYIQISDPIPELENLGIRGFYVGENPEYIKRETAHFYLFSKFVALESKKDRSNDLCGLFSTKFIDKMGLDFMEIQSRISI